MDALSGEAMMKRLVEAVATAIKEAVTQSVYAAVTMDLEDFKDQRKALEKQISGLQKELGESQRHVEEQEQYSRRNCLRFLGIPEQDREDTDKLVIELVNDKLGVPMQAVDIDRSHRVTPKPGSEPRKGPRPIIVKFTRYNVRNSVYRSKRKLKGSRVVILEDITQVRRNLIHEASKKSSVKRCWTSDGKITALVREHGEADKKVRITSMKDIERLN